MKATSILFLGQQESLPFIPLYRWIFESTIKISSFFRLFFSIARQVQFVSFSSNVWKMLALSVHYLLPRGQPDLNNTLLISFPSSKEGFLKSQLHVQWSIIYRKIKTCMYFWLLFIISLKIEHNFEDSSVCWVCKF